MTPQRLRQLFTDVRLTHPVTTKGVPAAILIPLFFRGSELMMLFTQRTYLVKHHRGQISFPGGVFDPEDDNLLSTALRESQEEIGLAPEKIDVLGYLNTSLTTTGFLVHSFVGLIPYPYPFRLNPREVQELIEVPLAFVMDRANLSVGPCEQDGLVFQAEQFIYAGHVIWGATARIIHLFRETLWEAMREEEGCTA